MLKISVKFSANMIWKDVKYIFKDRALGLIVYGSEAMNHHLVPPAQHNFLIVLQDIFLKDLDKLSEMQRKWARRLKTYPLVLTEKEIYSSTSTLPIEFSNIKETGELLAGLTKVLRDMEITFENLLLECKSNFKAKLFVFRQAYIEKPQQKRRILKESFHAFLVIFYNILRLLGFSSKIRPTNYIDTLKVFCEQTDTDEQAFLDVANIAFDIIRYKDKDVDKIFENYLAQLYILFDFMDSLDITN